MCAKKKTQFFFLLTAFLSVTICAGGQSLGDQTGPKSSKENSPYSRYGIGDLSNSRSAILKGMGGAATGFTDPFSVNHYNPASYSFIKVTSLDFAIEGSSRSIFMNDVSTSSGTTTFSYLTLGIPLGKYGGMALGIAPVSNIYYNASDTLTNLLGKGIVNYNGTGSMQYAYIGLSGQLGGLSVGVNGGYLFGNSRYTSSWESIDTFPVRNSDFSKFNKIGDLYWKAGALYKVKLKKNQYINLAATVTLSQQINAHRDAYDVSYRYVASGSGVSVLKDTIPQTSVTDLKGYIQMPAEYSFGVHYGKNFNWNVGADFIYTDWKKFENFGDRTFIGDNAWRLALGGEVTPAPESKKFFSLTTYRLGLYYAKDYFEVAGHEIKDFGGTIGVSFPLKRTYSQFGRVNTALNIGRRGTVQDGLAREFYVRFTVGVSLNDIWFTKRKYD